MTVIGAHMPADGVGNLPELLALASDTGVIRSLELIACIWTVPSTLIGEEGPNSGKSRGP
jgi:hypothetical protein